MVDWNVIDTILEFFPNLSASARIPAVLIDGQKIIWSMERKSGLNTTTRNMNGCGEAVA